MSHTWTYIISNLSWVTEERPHNFLKVDWFWGYIYRYTPVATPLTTKCGAGRICGAHRHWSVLITWLIRILSLSPAVSIQQFATLNLTLTLILTLTPTLTLTVTQTLTLILTLTNPAVITDPQIGRRDPQIVTVQMRPADPRPALHFVACHFGYLLATAKYVWFLNRNYLRQGGYVFSPVSVCLFVSTITRKLLFKSVWNFMECLDIIRDQSIRCWGH